MSNHTITFTDWNHYTWTSDRISETGILDWTSISAIQSKRLPVYMEAIRQATLERWLAIESNPNVGIYSYLNTPIKLDGLTNYSGLRQYIQTILSSIYQYYLDLDIMGTTFDNISAFTTINVSLIPISINRRLPIAQWIYDCKQFIDRMKYAYTYFNAIPIPDIVGYWYGYGATIPLAVANYSFNTDIPLLGYLGAGVRRVWGGGVPDGTYQVFRLSTDYNTGNDGLAISHIANHSSLNSRNKELDLYAYFYKSGNSWGIITFYNEYPDSQEDKFKKIYDSWTNVAVGQKVISDFYNTAIAPDWTNSYGWFVNNTKAVVRWNVPGGFIFQ